MKLTIDTDVLHKYHMSWPEFLDRLKGWLGLSLDTLLDVSTAFSDNSKDLVARILVESSPKLNKSPVKDFELLARKLMDIYPEGNKAGTTYPWRGTVGEIAQKLRVLVVQHDFIFTEKEAVNAVKAYVYTFQEKGDYTRMKLLKYFLLRTKDREISSDFMTIIENGRYETDNR